MKKLIFIILFLIPIGLFAQNMNPFLAQGIISPAPLYDVSSNGTGQISLIIGNSGDDEIPYSINEELIITIELKKGIPNNQNPLLALDGSFINYFTWSYNATTNKYTGIQNQTLPSANGVGAGFINIDYKVTENSVDQNPSNGFIASLTVPSLIAISNSIGDDLVSSFTWTIPSTDISSGVDGGLESNGNLGSLISFRNFKRQQETLPNTKQNQIPLKNISFKNGDLNKFLPNESNLNLSSFLSTPTDLVDITNATDVLSVDYYNANQKREAAILITETSTKVYNHTKSICDRLKNATLLAIKNKSIASQNFIVYTLRQNDGTLEYVTCFSLSDQDNIFTIHNQWLISQYPTKNTFYNFQIWTNNEPLQLKVIDEVLAKINSIKTYSIDTTPNKIPTVYFKQGIVNNQGEIAFDITNNTAIKSATLVFNYTHSEHDVRISKTFPITLIPNKNNTINIPFDGLFDTDVQLLINDTIVDEMYLADGAWGVDYPTTSSVNTFDILADNVNDLSDAYTIHRSAKLTATISEYISLYKMLKPSNMTVDLTQYNYINVDIATANTLIIRLNKKEITEWQKQAKYSLDGNIKEQKVSIPMNFLVNEQGEPIHANDVTNISFTTLSDGKTKINTSIAINKISFSKNALYNIASQNRDEINVYPTPIENNNNITITYNSSSNEESEIKIISTLGKEIFSQKVNTHIGNNMQMINLNKNIIAGIYIIEISTGNKQLKKVIPIN